MVARLVEMGFGVKESLDALQSTNNNLESACAMLAQQSVDYGRNKAEQLVPSLSQHLLTPPHSPAQSKHKTPPVK